MDYLVEKGSDKTLGFNLGDVVGCYDDDGSHLMRIDGLLMAGGTAHAKGVLITGRRKGKRDCWQITRLRRSGGIVAKWGFRVGDIVRLTNSHTTGTIFQLTSEKRCHIRSGACRWVDVHVDELELIERDPLLLDWMKQDKWNLGDRLGERTDP